MRPVFQPPPVSGNQTCYRAPFSRAERERFELSRPLRAYGISSAAPSTKLGDRSVGHSSNQGRLPWRGRAVS
jgi:hypothetical protein